MRLQNSCPKKSSIKGTRGTSIVQKIRAPIGYFSSGIGTPCTNTSLFMFNLKGVFKVVFGFGSFKAGVRGSQNSESIRTHQRMARIVRTTRSFNSEVCFNILSLYTNITFCVSNTSKHVSLIYFF